MITTKRGTIEGFHGSWGSGLGYLVIDGQPVLCENGATVRALQGAFGNVIDPGHTASVKGRHEVVYSIDGMGLLLGFTPIEEWTGPEIPEEGIEENES